MNEPVNDEALEIQRLLRRIGWHPSDLKQIEIYARMEPKQKIEQMFRVRREQMRLLEKRLRTEHPDYSDEQIFWMIQEHLDMVREDRFGC